jgi:hypothetical protein
MHTGNTARIAKWLHSYFDSRCWGAEPFTAQPAYLARASNGACEALQNISCAHSQSSAGCTLTFARQSSAVRSSRAACTVLRDGAGLRSSSVHALTIAVPTASPSFAESSHTACSSVVPRTVVVAHGTFAKHLRAVFAAPETRLSTRTTRTSRRRFHRFRLVKTQISFKR